MSVLSPVVDTWDGDTRRIFLRPGVSAFHWIDDIYKEYRKWRREEEAARKWAPLLRADGNNPKGGGKFTPRYVTLLSGARVVPYDEDSTIQITGEAITDNPDVDPNPFDTSTRTESIKLYIEQPTAEVIRVSTGGVDFTIEAVAAAVVDKIISGSHPDGSVADYLKRIEMKADDNLAMIIAAG
jgi:hypothetical protein